jgi:hypothetical protein
MLDTKAKYNIIFEELVRKLGVVIYNVGNLKIIIVSKYNFGFINIVMIQIDIRSRISYKEYFFLVIRSPKIFLRQLFINYI